MLRCLLAASALLAIGCHHAPPPKPPAPERALAKPGDLAGSWVTSDDLDWGYHLVIDDKGALTQTIDRGRMGVCEQRAMLTAGPTPRAFPFTFAKDTCDEGGDGAARTLEVVSFTADALVVILRGGVAPVHRRYAPDPKAGAAEGLDHPASVQ